LPGYGTLKWLYLDPLMLICTVAPVLLTDVTVNVIPAVESVNV
jgi:hypothetical protein